jgi:hypothetical protein
MSECGCDGILKPLSDLSFSPKDFLDSKSSWARTSADNPEHMWQVLLSQVHFSNFSAEEISCFTICRGHEVIYLSVSA